MPRGDRRGPQGMGPMTGRGMGYCAGYDTPGFANPAGAGFGRGMAWGRGRAPMGGGRGMAWGRGGGGWGGYGSWGTPPVNYTPAYSPSAPEDEKTYLEMEMDNLKTHMEAIQKRLDQLSASDNKK